MGPSAAARSVASVRIRRGLSVLTGIVAGVRVMRRWNGDGMALTMTNVVVMQVMPVLRVPLVHVIVPLVHVISPECRRDA